MSNFVKKQFMFNLLASSLACLALAGCGTDAKPKLPQQGSSSGSGSSSNSSGVNADVFVKATAEKNTYKEGDTVKYTVFLDLKSGAKYTDTPIKAKYTLTGSALDLLQDPSKASGEIELNKNKTSVSIEIPLKSDGKPSVDKELIWNLTPVSGGGDYDNTNNKVVISNTDAGLAIADAIISVANPKAQVTILPDSATALNQDLVVNFKVADGTAKAGTDFKALSNSVTLKAGQKSVDIPFEILNKSSTVDKTFTIELQNNGALPNYEGKSRATITISKTVVESDKRGKLNDTGVKFSGNSKANDADCSASASSQQDCKTGANAKGETFKFTKLDANGNNLPDSAAKWSCVRDEVTGLVWETKSADKTNYRYSNNTAYGFYDPRLSFGYKGSCLSGNCTTATYLTQINKDKVCGLTNWRLPKRAELLGVMNLNSGNYREVMHAGWLFPNEADDMAYVLWTNSFGATRKDGEPQTAITGVWEVNYQGGYEFAEEPGKSNFSGTGPGETAGIIAVSNGK